MNHLIGHYDPEFYDVTFCGRNTKKIGNSDDTFRFPEWYPQTPGGIQDFLTWHMTDKLAISPSAKLIDEKFVGIIIGKNYYRTEDEFVELPKKQNEKWLIMIILAIKKIISQGFLCAVTTDIELFRQCRTKDLFLACIAVKAYIFVYFDVIIDNFGHINYDFMNENLTNIDFIKKITWKEDNHYLLDNKKNREMFWWCAYCITEIPVELLVSVYECLDVF